MVGNSVGWNFIRRQKITQQTYSDTQPHHICGFSIFHRSDKQYFGKPSGISALRCIPCWNYGTMLFPCKILQFDRDTKILLIGRDSSTFLGASHYSCCIFQQMLGKKPIQWISDLWYFAIAWQRILFSWWQWSIPSHRVRIYEYYFFCRGGSRDNRLSRKQHSSHGMSEHAWHHLPCITLLKHGTYKNKGHGLCICVFCIPYDLFSEWIHQLLWMNDTHFMDGH